MAVPIIASVLAGPLGATMGSACASRRQSTVNASQWPRKRAVTARGSGARAYEMGKEDKKKTTAGARTAADKGG